MRTGVVGVFISCIALFGLAATAAGTIDDFSGRTGPADPVLRNGKILPALQATAREKGAVRVIVELELDAQQTKAVDLSDERSRRLRAGLIGSAQDDALRGVQGGRLDVDARFQTVPFLAVTVDEFALNQLTSSSGVIGIYDNPVDRMHLASSIPVIGADNVWPLGIDGDSQVVAILDTGVDKNHPFFTTGGLSVVSEACYSTDGGTVESLCPGDANSTAANSALACVGDAAGVSGCDHGTHVAGIAAGDDGIGPDIGVARDAGIIAIQVFSRFNDSTDCAPSSAPCLLTYASDQILGLERVLALTGTFNIAAVNMSLGGGTNASVCDGSEGPRKAAIDNLLAAGVSTVISSGNNGFTGATGAPGCISTAVTVGATTDSDNVASFSNSAPFVDLLAPGVAIDSSVTPGTGVGSKQGTSMSAPHVTGAFAVMRSANPGQSAAAILANLVATGTSVDDLRSGGVETDMRRINLDFAVSCNEDPDADLGGPYNIPEGSNTALDASGTSDDQIDATLDFDWDLDDDTFYDDATGISPTFTTNAVDGPATLPIELLVTDGCGQTDTAAGNVNILNVPPEITTLSATDELENGVVSLTCAFTDPGPGDTFTVSIDWGEGAPEVFGLGAGVFDCSRTHQYLDDNPTATSSDVYSIEVTVTDDDAGADTESTPSTITNVDPVTAIDPPVCERIDEGDTWTRSGSFSDVGTQDTHTATVDYDEGDGPIALTLAGFDFDLSNTYETDGTFTVEVVVADDDLGSHANDVEVRVTNLDPWFSVNPNQYLEGVRRFQQDVLVVPDELLPVAQAVPTFLTSQAGLNALDVMPNGDILFSPANGTVISNNGNAVSLFTGRIYRRIDATGDIVTELNPQALGVNINEIDAFDALADGTYAISLGATQAVSVGGGFQTLYHQNVYIFDPAGPSVTTFWDAAADGVPNVDAVDILPDGRLLFSTSTSPYVSIGGSVIRLWAADLYRIDPVTKIVELIFDGSTRGVTGNLDAASVGSTDGEYPETCN